MERLKDWSDIVAKWVAIIGALIGAVFALVKYYDNSHAERIKETLKYVDRFNAAEMRSAVTPLDKFWKDRAEIVFKKKQDELENYVVHMIFQNKLDKQADKVIDFYEDLSICTQTALCDEKTAKRYFGKKAYDFFGMNYPYIAYLRQYLKDESFGCGVEVIAKSYIRNKPVAETVCGAKNR